jgi:hypothetical protein
VDSPERPLASVKGNKKWSAVKLTIAEGNEKQN